jgi:hypothetical protein
MSVVRIKGHLRDEFNPDNRRSCWDVSPERLVVSLGSLKHRDYSA